MRTLFDSPHFTAEYDPQIDVIFIRRHATPYASLADIPPVFDALISRQGARAEAIMREHANATLRYAEVFGAISNSERMKVIARGE